jgi:hypothetical protein
MSPAYSKRIATLSRANAQTSVPVDLTGSEKTRENQHVMLEINRLRDGTTGALDGTIAIYGADLPEKTRPDATHHLSEIVLPGSGAYTFDTTIAYAAFSNYNWIVKVAGTILAYKSTPDAATNWAVSDNGGLARITIGTSGARPVDGSQLEVYKVTPVEILADGANEVVRTEILAPTLAWAVTAGTPASATIVDLSSRA